MPAFTAADVVALARECIGTPFKHQGRMAITQVAPTAPDGFKGGMDCAGVVRHVAHELTQDYRDVTGYSRVPHGNRLKQILDDQPCLTEISRSEKAAGDVLLMRLPRDPQHMGIYTGTGIVHSWFQIGTTKEHRIDAAWERRIVAVYRFNELM